MKRCRHFYCDYWRRGVCCLTCPRRELSGSKKCKNPCVNSPALCGGYIDEVIDTDANRRRDEHEAMRRRVNIERKKPERRPM
jgi:hypothetical protein